MPVSLATSIMRRVVGPSGMCSAVSLWTSSCTWQKYGALKSSWKHMTWAPCSAAWRAYFTFFSIIESLSPVQAVCTMAARTIFAMGESSVVSPRESSHGPEWAEAHHLPGSPLAGGAARRSATESRSRRRERSPLCERFFLAHIGPVRSRSGVCPTRRRAAR